MVPGHEQAYVRFTPDGGLEIRVGVHSHGQGLETTLSQVAHDILGLPHDRIKVVHGDTALTPYSTGTWGSRCMVMAGGAVAEACDQLALRLRKIAAKLLQCDVDEVRLEAGELRGPAGSIGIREVARVWYRRPQDLPPDVDPAGLEVTSGYKPVRDSGTFSYATHAALLAVDPYTGEVEILNYVVVEDGGVLVNPMIVDGQIYGGAAQGIGTALYEEMPFDTRCPATRLDTCRLYAAGPRRGACDRDRAYGDALALYAFRRQGHRRGRRHRPAGRDHECHQRCAAPARRRAWRQPGHAAPDRRRHRGRREIRRGPIATVGVRLMKPAAFEYERPRTVGDAVALLAQTENAKLLAGGQTLGPMLNLRLAQPDLIIDITQIPELVQAETGGDAVTLGACITHAAVEDGRLPDFTEGLAAQSRARHRLSRCPQSRNSGRQHRSCRSLRRLARLLHGIGRDGPHCRAGRPSRGYD